MKQLLQTLFFFLLVTQICFGQQGWTNQTKPSCRGLVSVYFINESVGWTVSLPHYNWHTEDSHIHKTSDGGETWIQQNSGTLGWLFDIGFTDNSIGITVGYGGKIFRTTNGGDNWVQQSSGTVVSLHSICFVGAGDVWIVGGGEDIWAPDTSVVLHSTNGGTSWIEQPTSSLKSLFDVSFANTNNGIAVGQDGAVMNTSNGGTTWTSQNSGTTQTLFGVRFFDTSNAIVVGDSGTILRSTNGGTSWISQTNITTNNLEDVYFLDSQRGWIVGENGTVLVTADGGNNWSNLVTGTYLPLRSIYFTDSYHGIVVGGISGRQSPDAGVILKTIDGGQVWEPQTGTGILPLSDVSFFDSNFGIAVGSYSFPWSGGPTIRTTNGGESWIIQEVQFHAHKVDCINSIVAYRIGYNENGGGGAISKSTDKGLTWFDQTIHYRMMQGISFSDVNTGTMVGYVDSGGACGIGIILRTTDGGSSWFDQNNPTGLPLNEVCFIDANYGWTVGSTSSCNVNGGVILNTTDGGNNWNVQWTSQESPLIDVCFTDVNHGWAVGYGGRILHTTNGGTNWFETIDTTFEVKSVEFIDNNIGWLVGYHTDTWYAKILHTNDGGVTWFEQETGSSEWINGICFLDANNGWVVGGGGAILHTTNGGVSFVEEEVIDEIPAEFLLSQNYPNPFNPSTKIKYSVPNYSQVVIKVFDILGNEIETLVNEEKTPGTYELTWSAANLPSGVYFYQLKAGEYINTKKMIFLK